MCLIHCLCATGAVLSRPLLLSSTTVKVASQGCTFAVRDDIRFHFPLPNVSTTQNPSFFPPKGLRSSRVHHSSTSPFSTPDADECGKKYLKIQRTTYFLYCYSPPLNSWPFTTCDFSLSSEATMTAVIRSHADALLTKSSMFRLLR